VPAFRRGGLRDGSGRADGGHDALPLRGPDSGRFGSDTGRGRASALLHPQRMARNSACRNGRAPLCCYSRKYDDPADRVSGVMKSTWHHECECARKDRPKIEELIGARGHADGMLTRGRRRTRLAPCRSARVRFLAASDQPATCGSGQAAPARGPRKVEVWLVSWRQG